MESKEESTNKGELTNKEIMNAITLLKMIQPQTLEIKKNIQKLQQKLS